MITLVSLVLPDTIHCICLFFKLIQKFEKEIPERFKISKSIIIRTIEFLVLDTNIRHEIQNNFHKQ